MKKKKKNKQMYSLTKKAANNSISSVSDIDAKIDETDQKIAEGLSKETASTGTPMETLDGAAKITATLSNIGGGSKQTGGGGMVEGVDTLLQNVALKSVKKGMEYQKQIEEKHAEPSELAE